MKNKKNISDEDRVAILKRREKATGIAGMALTVAAVACFPLAMFGGMGFEKKVEDIIEPTGYYEYAETQKAEYKNQYDNGEIPRDVYKAYVEYYDTTGAVREYFDSIGETEKMSEVEGTLKGRNIYTITFMGLGIASALSGYGCLVASRRAYQELGEYENAQSSEDGNLPDAGDIFPELSDKKKEEDGEEDEEEK